MEASFRIETVMLSPLDFRFMMASPARSGDMSKSAFLPSNQNNAQSSAPRAAPNVLNNFPPNLNSSRRDMQQQIYKQQLQQTTHQQLQQLHRQQQQQQQPLPVPHSRNQYMPRPKTLAEAYRAQDSNYTSKPIDYPFERRIKCQVAGAPGIHKTHPSLGARPILQV